MVNFDRGLPSLPILCNSQALIPFQFPQTSPKCIDHS